MKILDGKNAKLSVHTGVLNVFSLGALSFTWAHFLGLISLWFIPITLLMYLIGYGSEIKSGIDFK